MQQQILFWRAELALTTQCWHWTSSLFRWGKIVKSARLFTRLLRIHLLMIVGQHLLCTPKCHLSCITSPAAVCATSYSLSSTQKLSACLLCHLNMVLCHMELLWYRYACAIGCIEHVEAACLMLHGTSCRNAWQHPLVDKQTRGKMQAIDPALTGSFLSAGINKYAVISLCLLGPFTVADQDCRQKSHSGQCITC